MSTYYATIDKALAGPLGPDERILWQGKPFPGILLRAPGLAPIWFGWVFFLFSLFWMSGVLSQMSAVDWSRIAFAAFGIPFVVIGFYLAILQYPWNAYVRRNTVYSLTNRRAILSRTGVLGKGLKSYPITPNTNIEYASLAGGSIWFATETAISIEGSSEGSTSTPIGFVGIENPQAVYRLILEIQQGAK